MLIQLSNVLKQNNDHVSQFYRYLSVKNEHMYPKLYKFAVTTITILAANLISGKITDYMVNYKYKTHIKPIAFTLIAMGIIMLIYYPLITRMEVWLNKGSSRIIKSGRSLGGRYLGLLIMYLLCMAVLLYFYAKMWYKVDIIQVILQGKLGLQFK